MRTWSLVGLIIASMAFGWWNSHRSTQLAVEREAAAQLKADSILDQLETLNQRSEKLRVLMAEYQAIKQEVKYVDRKVTEKVIEYRDVVINRCQLDSMWASTYNLSTMSKVGDTGGTNDPTHPDGTTIDAADALNVVTYNNRNCVAEKERLSALQRLVHQM